MNSKFLLIVIAVLLGVGCANQPENITYVEAQPIKDPAPANPAVVQIAKPLPLPGQLKEKPGKQDSRKKNQKPWKVIESANKAASQNPDDYGYFNAVMQYDYALGALYQVYAAPLKLTDIQLQPGEKILGKPAAGDTVRWVMGVGQSKVNGLTRQHVYVKPTKPGLHTTLSINTDKRTYHMELHSYKETYMAAINWRYPHDEMLALQAKIADDEAKKNQVIASGINILDLNSNYKIDTIKGKPRWKPVGARDDGKKTYIEFPKEMLNRESPVLYVYSSNEEVQIVNYRQVANFYIVDRLFDRAELRLGQKKQDIVRIVRKGYKPKRNYNNDDHSEN